MIGRSSALGAGVVLVGLMAVGCGNDSFNQGLTALAKLRDGRMSELTASDVKILNQGIVGLAGGQFADPEGLPPMELTDAQCAALVAFFQANHLDSVAAIEQAKSAAAADPASVQGLADLAAAFAGVQTAIDFNNVTSAIFEQTFFTIFGYPGGAV